MAEQDMSVSYQFTKAGNNLSAKALAGTVKIDFTRAELSTTSHFGEAEADISGLTELDGVTQTVDLKEVDAVEDDPSFVKIPVQINETAVTEDYALLTIGLYCKPDDGDEVLYSICSLKDPIYIHKSSNNSTFTLNLNTLVGSAANVVIKADPAGMVTHADFDAMMKRVAFVDKPNVFSERQTLAGGATDGEGNAYATTKDVATGLNNGLSTKVTDNKDGTEQLNGVQVQPFNKLSDTVGGRNLLPISSYSSGYVNGDDGSASSASTAKEVISDFVPVDITQSYYCQIIQQVNNGQAWYAIGFYDNNKQFISRSSNGNTIVTGTITSVIRMLPSGFPNVHIPNVYTVNFPATTAYVRVSFRTYGNPIQSSLEKSSVLSDWTPAPEDKVNVTDMRKPASDVAGIEEVNAKQDKIGYTPADDSKVAHLSGANNFDTVPTVNNNPLLLASSLPSDLARTSQQTNFTDGLQKGGKDVATVDEVADAKAAAITQALNDAKAEIAKLPKHVTLTQAQFDALATKDANTYYYITAG